MTCLCNLKFDSYLLICKNSRGFAGKSQFHTFLPLPRENTVTVTVTASKKSKASSQPVTHRGSQGVIPAPPGALGCQKSSLVICYRGGRSSAPHISSTYLGASLDSFAPFWPNFPAYTFLCSAHPFLCAAVFSFSLVAYQWPRRNKSIVSISVS